MNNSRHLIILAILLATLGLALTFYQIFALKTPLTENQLTDLWTIDARISFNLPESKAVELQFQLPPRWQGYDISNELFIANGYGQSILDNGQSRVVSWTARRLSGQQNIFYRFNIAKSADAEAEVMGETWRAPMQIGDTEKIAVAALATEIRQKSVDTLSFISTAMSKIDDAQDDNVKLLLAKEDSPQARMHALELLLSQAHIPMQTAHLLRLSDGGVHEPELWARSYIEVSKDQDEGWYYFNLKSISKGLPQDRLLWWVGDDPIIKSSTGAKAHVSIQVAKDELTARSMLRLASGDSDFSLYSLPLVTQFAYKLMLMIPFGVFIILIIRNVVGIETLGTFTPVLIALAFRDTGLIFGAVFFTVIISVGLLLRAYLEYLKLQMLPRLSIVLTAVIILIIASSMLSFKLGFERGLAITLFPMVILTMSIERLSITWEERGGPNAFRVTLGTMLAAALVYLVLELEWLSYFVFSFPGTLLVIIAVMLGLGRYSGYRLMELIRFKALLKKG